MGPPRSAEAREDFAGELLSRRCFLRAPPSPPGHKIKIRAKWIPQSEGGQGKVHFAPIHSGDIIFRGLKASSWFSPLGGTGSAGAVGTMKIHSLPGKPDKLHFPISHRKAVARSNPRRSSVIFLLFLASIVNRVPTCQVNARLGRYPVWTPARHTPGG
jgi:hypothetical protein